MGKIKTRTIGDENLETKQKQEQKQKAAEKKLAKDSAEPVSEIKAEEPKQTKAKKVVKKAKKAAPHSSSYQKMVALVDKNKKYNLSEALELLERLKRSKFDETVELHINTIETGVSGQVTLPHGTGKEVRVAIANDEILAKVAAGKIDFDILLADPSMMPKLARVARILGPKGLMPNPKNATLVKDPAKAAENFKKGQINFKTELKAPIIHLIVGKLSFGGKKLAENIDTMIGAIRRDKIRNVTLKSTMSPGIKLEI